MNLVWVCQKCFWGEKLEEFQGSPGPVVVGKIELRNDGRYDVVCQHGHRSTILLQQQSFEVLFDLGCMAILDGYYREAVSSFVAASERLYEFFIRVIMHHRGVSEEELDNTWGLVKNQSERQLGAFYFLFLEEVKKAPYTTKNAINRSTFRNDVIHKGIIPSYEQVMELGEYMLTHMNGIIKLLKENYPESVQFVVSQRMAKLIKSNDAGVGTLSIATVISLTNGEKDYGTKSFYEELTSFSQRVKQHFISK